MLVTNPIFIKTLFSFVGTFLPKSFQHHIITLFLKVFLKKMTVDFDFVSGLRAHDVPFFVIVVKQ